MEYMRVGTFVMVVFQALLNKSKLEYTSLLHHTHLSIVKNVLFLFTQQKKKKTVFLILKNKRPHYLLCLTLHGIHKSQFFTHEKETSNFFILFLFIKFKKF